MQLIKPRHIITIMIIIAPFLIIALIGCSKDTDTTSKRTEISFEQASQASGAEQFKGVPLSFSTIIKIDANYVFGPEGSGKCGPLSLSFKVNSVSKEPIPSNLTMYQFWILSGTSSGWSLEFDNTKQVTTGDEIYNTACGGSSSFKAYQHVDVVVQIGDGSDYDLLKVRDVTIMPAQ